VGSATLGCLVGDGCSGYAVGVPRDFGFTVADKFPGSWSKVALICAVIVVGQILRVTLLQPSMARWSPEPATQPPEVKASQASANLVSGSANEALELVARYEDEFTPALDLRVRAYADQLGMDSSRVGDARSIFLLLAGKGLLVEPAVMLAEPPDGWDSVCGEGEPGYVCLTLTGHVNYMAEHSRFGGGARPR